MVELITRECKQKDSILNVLSAHYGVTCQKISELTLMPAKDVGYLLRTLKKEGKVIKFTKKRAGKKQQDWSLSFDEVDPFVENPNGLEDYPFISRPTTPPITIGYGIAVNGALEDDADIEVNKLINKLLEAEKEVAELKVENQSLRQRTLSAETRKRLRGIVG
mgnify:CR=1 FL=1